FLTPPRTRELLFGLQFLRFSVSLYVLFVTARNCHWKAFVTLFVAPHSFRDLLLEQRLIVCSSNVAYHWIHTLSAFAFKSLLCGLQLMYLLAQRVDDIHLLIVVI